ncbi:LiaI-LiaF-like domain-containing protein [Acidicapsa dinghuensis]|uniref:LiaI-LiaF-like domain-containing protein n=1 Tax=Acidicapsa dinghuensis TaxID=2218256 RepID=A0ABW1EBC9_9BACT|nr:B-box zinc finger protein [Acidicapsa dinghuensis]
MPCVNHPNKDVQSYCQNCGKALCSECVRTTPTGQVLCEQCFTSGAGAVPPGAIPPFIPIPPGGPNPSAAAVLGLIPGVGAMYNGQLFKGLIHVVIFAILVSITDRYGVFGIFIGAWVLYQSFEAYHTAKARRDGQPVPDPFGLNELGNWLNIGSWYRNPGAPPAPDTNPGQGNPYGGTTPPYGTQYPSGQYPSGWTGAPGPGTTPGAAGGPGSVPPQANYSEPFTGYGQTPYPAQDPYSEPYPPGAIPPIPPMPPFGWRRREPVFAFVLIGLGLIFLLQSMGFVSHVMHYIWPLMLIGLGVWLVMRQMGYTQGGRK